MSIAMMIIIIVVVIIQKKNKRYAGHSFDTNKSFRCIFQPRLSMLSRTKPFELKAQE